jgi:hypothetical protein
VTETKEVDVTGLHDKPILTSGSGGPAVFQLCNALNELGYETSVSRGENPYGIVDGSVATAVQQFRADRGVEEDAAAFGGEDLAKSHIGPATWIALRDAISEPPPAVTSQPTEARESVAPVTPVSKPKSSTRSKSSSKSSRSRSKSRSKSKSSRKKS